MTQYTKNIPIKKAVFKNWTVKLLSLIIAIFLWRFVYYQKTTVVTIQAHIKYINLPTTLAYVKKPTWYLKVYLRIPKNHINFQNNELNPQVDLSRATPKKNNYKVILSHKLLPENITIINYKKYVKVYLNKKVTKEVSIIPNIIGTPQENHILHNIILEPNKIVIYGAEQQLKQINEIRTNLINILDKNTSLKKSIKLQTNNSIIDYSHKTTKVSINISKNTEKTLILKNITTNTVLSQIDYEITPKKYKVFLSGNSSILNNIGAEHIQLQINLNEEIQKIKNKLLETNMIKVKLPIEYFIDENYRTNITLSKIEPKETTVIFRNKEVNSNK